MNKRIKGLISVFLCATLVFSFSACGKVETAEIEKLFTDLNKVSYSNSYKELKTNKRNKTKTWRQGMVSGNGMQGFVESGSPYSDTFIFQNMHFIMPNDIQRTCPETFNELETVKQNIVKGENIPPAGTPEAFKVLFKELQALGLDTILYDRNGEEVELKQDLDDDGIPAVSDDKAFTEVNDYEGQEGYGVLDENGESAEAVQEQGDDDMFAGFANLFADSDE